MYCYRNILFQGLLHVKRGTLKCSILSHNLTSRQFIKIMFPSIATMATTNKHKRMLLYSINYFADIAFITTQEVFFPQSLLLTFMIFISTDTVFVAEGMFGWLEVCYWYSTQNLSYMFSDTQETIGRDVKHHKYIMSTVMYSASSYCYPDFLFIWPTIAESEKQNSVRKGSKKKREKNLYYHRLLNIQVIQQIG